MAGSDNRDHRDTGTEETREDVLAVVHALCKGFKDAGFDGDAHDIRVLFERLEAAHKRELESVTKRNGLGNVAKLREALEKCAEWGVQIDNQLAGTEDTVWAFRGERCLAHNIALMAREALAAPPRNCDVFADAQVANARFQRMCDDRGNGLQACVGCKYNDTPDGFPAISRCRVSWLYDTAPAEGGTK